MKKYASDIYDNVLLPISFDEFLGVVQKPIDDESGVVRMWRGQDDISWPVHSSAYRRLSLDGSIPTEREIRSYEESLLRRATHRGYRELDGVSLSDFELLARIRHHGAATRLVDATRNALVGLYFAAAYRPKTTGLLLGLHTQYLGGYEGYPERRKYQDVFKELEEYRHPQTWEPPIVSRRIAAQHSQFLYSAVSDQKTGSLWIKAEPDSYVAVAISPTMKELCVRILSDIFDIRQETLFPDIDGFGAANSHNIGRWDTHRW